MGRILLYLVVFAFEVMFMSMLCYLQRLCLFIMLVWMDGNRYRALDFSFLDIRVYLTCPLLSPAVLALRLQYSVFGNVLRFRLSIDCFV